MSRRFWKIASLLTLVFSTLLLLACSNNDKNTPNGPDKEASVEFIAPTMVMSLGESQLLSNLLTEGSAPVAQIKFDVMDDKVARIENVRLISVGAGETEVKASFGDTEVRSSLLVQDFRQIYVIQPEAWIKYIWDYTSSPSQILNRTGRPVVVVFGADWCSGCKMLEPIVDRLSKSYDGRALFLKVDLTKKDSPGYQIFKAMSQSNHEALKPLKKVVLPSVVMIPTLSEREPQLHLSSSNANNVISDFLKKEFNAQ